MKCFYFMFEQELSKFNLWVLSSIYYLYLVKAFFIFSIIWDKRWVEWDVAITNEMKGCVLIRLLGICLWSIWAFQPQNCSYEFYVCLLFYAYIICDLRIQIVLLYILRAKSNEIKVKIEKNTQNKSCTLLKLLMYFLKGNTQKCYFSNA